MMQLSSTPVASCSGRAIARGSAVSRSVVSRPVILSQRPSVSARAGPKDDMNNSGPLPANGTIFFQGKAYTEAEYDAAVQSGAVAMAPSPKANAGGTKNANLFDIMSFGGQGPEIINGRLAMLGFIAAIGAEFNSGDGLLRQVAEEPTLIGATFALLMAGSLVPFINGSKRDESFAIFNPNAEMLNGRAAMIGFAAMLIIEATSGKGLLMGGL